MSLLPHCLFYSPFFRPPWRSLAVASQWRISTSIFELEIWVNAGPGFFEWPLKKQVIKVKKVSHENTSY